MGKHNKRNAIKRVLDEMSPENLDWSKISRDVFVSCLFTYLLFLLLEELRIGLISYFFSLNVLATITAISGVIAFLTNHRNEKKPETVTKSDYYLVFTLGVVGAAVVFYQTKALGILSYLLALLSLILIPIFCTLLLEQDYSSDENKTD